MLVVAGASDTAHNAFGVDGRHEHRVFDCAEWTDERRGFEILVKLDYAKHMLSLRVHDSETHVTTKLCVRLFGQILRVHNRAFSTDTPVPVRVNESEFRRVASHQRFDILWHGFSVQLEVFWQHSPPVAVTTASI